MSIKNQAQTPVQQSLAPLNMKVKATRLLINLIVLLVSLFLTLLLSEIVLRYMGWESLYVSPERDQFWKYDSTLGWVHQPGQEGIFETPQFRTSVHINQKGLRDDEHAYERANNTKRILVIGDSFAWGYGVEESERFSELLETSLGVEVINAGVSGYSTDQELLWFRNEGIKYDVDLVILIFTGNDIGDNDRQLINTIYYKPHFVKEDGQLILKGDPVPKASRQSKLIYYLSQRSAFVYLLVQRYFDLLTYYNRTVNTGTSSRTLSTSGTNSVEEPFELTITLLDDIRENAKAKEANFMIVATDGWWNSRSEQTYADFIDALQTNKFLVLDVESIAGFNPEKMHIPNDGHWNTTGHQFVAEQIKDFIENNELLSQP